MLTRRIIPCLDIKDGRTVKGTQFIDLLDAGDPLELAAFYSGNGADELIFLDITATIEKRKTFHQLVNRLAREINIPFSVGGGVSSVQDFYNLLNQGADKVCINTAAYKNPKVISEAASEFGSQCVVAAIDAGMGEDGKWVVYLNGGRLKTETTAWDWVRKAVDQGAGEILLTSINHDGTRNGFALDITGQFAKGLPVPVIASGGAGQPVHFKEVFERAGADAALAAGIFHFGKIKIPELKKYLDQEQIPVRL